MVGPYTTGTDTREPLYLGGTKGDGTTLGGISGLAADLHSRVDTTERSNLSPADHGYAAWAYPPFLVVGASAMTSGTPRVSKIKVPKYAAGVTFQNIDYFISVAGATLTGGDNWIAVYSSAGTLLGSIGQDAAFLTTGKLTATLGSAINLADTGGYLQVLIMSTGTTPPAPGRTASALSATIANANLAGTALRMSTTTSATTPPSTLTTLTADVNQVWFGLR